MVYGSVLYTSGAVGVLKQEALVSTNLCSLSKGLCPGIKENKDGTVTLTVEAVCDTVICNDAVITHELTVRFAEDGSFQYLGNEILNDGITSIPNYKYRIRKE